MNGSEAILSALLAGVAGLLLGVLLMATLQRSAVRRAAAAPARERSVGNTSAPAAGAAATPPATRRLAPGVVDVLSVLRSSTVLVDASDTVVSASSGAHAFGLVRANRLVSEDLRELVRAVRRDGRIREIGLELPRGPLGGETIAVSVRVALLGSQGEQGLVLALVEDRTESRRVDAVRRDFVANVSHELKTPVGALILLAEAVLGASDDPDAVRRFAERMQYEASRLSHLVQELIDLSRLQGHDPLREADVVELDDVVAEAVERVRLAAAARDITVHRGGEAGLSVLGDEAQLVTAVGNLVDNAVSYSPEHTRVAISVRRSGELAEISVTDQGIGIPERDLERIFERFYRVDPARSRATGGTGLGLSIVKHIVANHGGEVTVWSLEGSGSTFTVRLPIGAVLHDGELAHERPPLGVPSRPAGGARRLPAAVGARAARGAHGARTATITHRSTQQPVSEAAS